MASHLTIRPPTTKLYECFDCGRAYRSLYELIECPDCGADEKFHEMD